jgi:hypothetical protein
MINLNQNYFGDIVFTVTLYYVNCQLVLDSSMNELW